MFTNYCTARVYVYKLGAFIGRYNSHARATIVSADHRIHLHQSQNVEDKKPSYRTDTTTSVTVTIIINTVATYKSQS